MKPLEHHTCVACHLEWTRKATRGRVPSLCPTCRPVLRTAAKSHRKACPQCGVAGVRRDATYCSTPCAREAHGLPPEPLPKPPPVPRPVKAPRPHVALLALDCDWCGTTFTQVSTQQRMCSARCKRLAASRRRRARIAGTTTQWRWSDFMRLARTFGFQCAYCGTAPDEPLEPDHVVPISKGGPDALSNLLPACHSCNSSKRDLSLDQWAQSRARRGLTQVTTTWAADDHRVWHLALVTDSHAA